MKTATNSTPLLVQVFVPEAVNTRTSLLLLSLVLSISFCSADKIFTPFSIMELHKYALFRNKPSLVISSINVPIHP